MYASINGTRLYFDVEGCELVQKNGEWRKKPVCFILHGGPGGEHLGFKPYLTPLSEHMQLIYLDMRGCGRSDRGPRSTYTLDNNIDDLEALRKYLGLEKVIVLGHSYGGMVAQSYALRYPNSVSALLLIATTPGHGFDKQALRIVDEIGTEEQKLFAKRMFAGEIKDQEQMNEFWVVMDSLYSYLARGKEKTEEEKEAIRKKKSTFNYEVANAGLEFLAKFDVVDQLPQMTCPVLVIGGKYDWVTPADASILIAEKIPASELLIFEKSCHQIFVDENEKFNSEIISFIHRRVENSLQYV